MGFLMFHEVRQPENCICLGMLLVPLAKSYGLRDTLENLGETMDPATPPHAVPPVSCQRKIHSTLTRLAAKKVTFHTFAREWPVTLSLAMLYENKSSGFRFSNPASLEKKLFGGKWLETDPEWISQRQLIRNPGSKSIYERLVL